MLPRVAVILLSLATGCVEVRDGLSHAGDAGADHPEGAVGAQDASIEETPLLVSSTPPACTQPTGSCPLPANFAWRRLIAASDFGPGAEVRAASGQVALIALHGGSFQLAQLRPSDLREGGSYLSWPLDTGELVPIAMSDQGHPSDPSSIYVLACDAERRGCSVFHGSVARDQPPAFDARELPADFYAHGVFTDRSESDPLEAAPCAYGEGLICLRDGVWRVEIRANRAPMLRAVAIGWDLSLAVGEHGRWFTRGHGPVWNEQTPLEDVALTFASVARQLGVIVGGGRIRAVIGRELADALPCAPADEIDAFWLGMGTTGVALALSREGKLLFHSSRFFADPNSYCAQTTLPAGALGIGGAPSLCGITANERVLLSDGLWGPNACAVE